MTPFQSKLHTTALDCELRGWSHLAAGIRAVLAQDIAEYGLDGEHRDDTARWSRLAGEGVVLPEDGTGGGSGGAVRGVASTAPSPSSP